MRYNINIKIPLAPVAQKRPRFIRNSFRVYDPSAKDKIPFINFFQENIYDIDFKKLPSDNIFINQKLPCCDNNINFTCYHTKYVKLCLESAKKDFRVTSDLLPSKETLKIDLDFYFKRPKSHFLKAGNISNRFINNYPKIDIDNVCKFLLDCLQPQKNNKTYKGIIFNDSQIIKLNACKSYLNNQDLQPFIKLSLYN